MWKDKTKNSRTRWTKTAQNGKRQRKARETKKIRETWRVRQRRPYQCIAGGIRCNWGVCV